MIPAEDRHYLESIGLANWIDCFANSSTTGKAIHTPVVQNGKTYIRKEGRLTALEEIRSTIVCDTATNKLVSKNDTSEEWRYISPNGLVAESRDITKRNLYSIETLSAHELKHAYDNRITTLGGKKKTAIFQIVATYTSSSRKIQEVTFRCIEAGKLYSFGIEEGVGRELVVRSPHYIEAEPFVEKRVTSFAINSPRMSLILKKAKQKYTDKVEFVTQVLQEALPKKIFQETNPSPSRLSRVFSTVTSVPLIGALVQSVCRAVAYVFSIITTPIQYLFVSKDIYKIVADLQKKYEIQTKVYPFENRIRLVV